jgi:hypothetical protein
MSSIDALRKIIREEVTKVIKQELPKILKENSVPAKDYKENIQEQVQKNVFPMTLNEERVKPKPQFSKANPLGQLLNETAISMTSDDVHAFANSTTSTGELMGPSNIKVGSVDSMLNNAVKSSNIEMVQIDTVPDFSQFMKKMNIA